jgi:hypothetical protein
MKEELQAVATVNQPLMGFLSRPEYRAMSNRCEK